MPVAVKICGLKNADAVSAAVNAGADYVGFVYFPPSPRHITPAEAAKLMAKLPASTKSVMVAVDPDNDWIDQIDFHTPPAFIQLHGKETPDRVREIKSRCHESKIIKALPVSTGDDVAFAMRYSDCADMLLFDARPPKLPGILPGGNGLSFDWALLKDREFPLPWILSGGLTSDNVADAVRLSGATIVDVSSGVESAPGVKDASLIRDFIKAAKSA